MKNIEIKDDLYAYIASQTQHIGESASDILYRLLMPQEAQTAKQKKALQQTAKPAEPVVDVSDLLNDIQQTEGEKRRPKVEVFLDILSKLNKKHASEFEQVLAIKGANRLYFAGDKETLQTSGKSTNPKLIPDAGIWVVTNNNTAKKVSILLEVLRVLGYSNQTAQQVADYFSA